MTMKITIGYAIATMLFLSASFSKNSLRSSAAAYDTVRIGNQIWMTRNLDVEKFKNGDLIPEAKSKEEWENAGREQRPAWCYYNNDVAIGKKYGRMYNWYALTDSRGLIPEGWHLPILDEWIAFEKFVQNKPDGFLFQCSSGQQKTGFCALPGGYRSKDGNFTGIGEFTYLSGATAEEILDSDKSKQTMIWGRGLHAVQRSHMRCGLRKDFGLYVRCIKDK
jgi:uncharacterized protein (TIGR02145 family)